VSLGRLTDVARKLLPATSMTGSIKLAEKGFVQEAITKFEV
jgi:hypothetical protein